MSSLAFVRSIGLALATGGCAASAVEPTTPPSTPWFDMQPAATGYNGPTAFVSGTVFVVPAECLCNRNVGSDSEGRTVAGAGEQRAYAGAGEDRGYAGAGEDRGYAGAGEDRGYAGAGEDRGYASDQEDRGYAGAGEGREVGGAAEDRAYAGAAGVMRCRPAPTCDAVELEAGGSVIITGGSP